MLTSFSVFEECHSRRNTLHGRVHGCKQGRYLEASHICIALQLAFRRTPDHIFELADLHTPCKLHFKYTYLEAPPSSIARAGLEFSERVARLKPWPAIALPAPPVKPAQSCRLRFIMLGCSICVGLGGLP